MYNNIKLYVDGSLVPSKDSEGNVIEPFLYNGTAYVSAKAISEALGKGVTWDGKTQSIYIGKYDTESPTILLEDMDYINFQDNTVDKGSMTSWTISDKDLTGEAYENGVKYCLDGDYIVADEWNMYAEYLLDMKYTTFKGRLVRHYDTRTAHHPVILKIYAERELIYESEEMSSGDLPIDFEIDVTGVVKLSIAFIDVHKGEYLHSDCILGIVDAGFYE